MIVLYDNEIPSKVFPRKFSLKDKSYLLFNFKLSISESS
jgi:hypothetical protein